MIIHFFPGNLYKEGFLFVMACTLYELNCFVEVKAIYKLTQYLLTIGRKLIKWTII